MQENIPEFLRDSPTSKLFLKKFISAFMEGRAISIQENELRLSSTSSHRYVEELLKFLIKKFKAPSQLDELRGHYERYKQLYSIRQRWNVYEEFVDHLLRIEREEDALLEWLQLRKEEYHSLNSEYSYRESEVEKLIWFEKILNKGVIDGEMLFRIALKQGQLTQFGKRNIQGVINSASSLLREKFEYSFFQDFFVDFRSSPFSNYQFFELDHYEQFFTHSKTSLAQWKWISDRSNWKLSPYVRHDSQVQMPLIIAASRELATTILREAENHYRESIGAKKIGESWISETELYYLLKESFKDYQVIQHGRPDWLGRQHLDIWIPELNVGIEYQGSQHFNAIDFFGGDEGLSSNNRRDEEKRRKCRENGLRLIEVEEGYDINAIISLIMDSRFL